MQLGNTRDEYGLISIALHWSMAVLVVGLFVLGKYMVSLDYYHPLYLILPQWHLGLGLLTGVLLMVRLLWRWSNPLPQVRGEYGERLLAGVVHRLFYLLLLSLVLSGYVTATADGRPLEVLGWFDIPALYRGDDLADRAGALHQTLGWLLAVLFALHLAGALKHHFIDKDDTLRRMLGLRAGGGRES